MASSWFFFSTHMQRCTDKHTSSLLWNICSIYTVYKRGCGVHNTIWWTACWTPMSYVILQLRHYVSKKLENFIKGWLLHCEERSRLFETCEKYNRETFPSLQQIVSHLHTPSLPHWSARQTETKVMNIVPHRQRDFKIFYGNINVKYMLKKNRIIIK